MMAFFIMLLFPLSFFLLFKVIKKGGYFEFDKIYLYKVESQSEEKIALNTIYELEKPIVQLGTTKNWIIRYRDENGNKKEQRLRIDFYGENFSTFKALVKRTNKNLRINNWLE